jgi:hypothetical protein
MSFIDYINITFEEIVNNICENNDLIIDITHLESNVITLFKETKYNLNFNEKIDNIFSDFLKKYSKISKEITKLRESIKTEYNIYLNESKKKNLELISIYTYYIE